MKKMTQLGDAGELCDMKRPGLFKDWCILYLIYAATPKQAPNASHQRGRV